MIGDSITSALYQKALDGTWQRQKAISNNIANSETPGYKTTTVNFEDSLKAEINKLSSNSSSSGSSGFIDKMDSIQSIRSSNITVSSGDTSNRLDENNVDLEAENIEMSKTTLQYYYLVRGVTDNYSRLKYAISGGR